MTKKLRKPLSIILSIMMILSALTIIPMTANAADTPEVTMVFPDYDNDWGIPTSNTSGLNTYSNGTYSIKLYASNAYKMNSGYLLMGKQGAYLELPVFSFDVEKIVVTGNGGASEKVNTNIFVGDNAASTTVTGSTGTNTFEIASDYQAAGNVYRLKIENAYNAQITKIEIYKAESAPAPTTYTVTWKNWDGSVLETDADVAEGATPEYNGVTPVKADDDYYTYSFAGWSPEVTAVTGDVEYAATFNHTAKTEDGLIKRFTFEFEEEFNEMTFINAPSGTKWEWSGKRSDGRDLSPEAYQGKYFVSSFSYRDGPYQADQWMITPAIEIPNYVVTKLSFYAQNADIEYPEPVDVYVGTSADPASMTKLQTINPPLDNADLWERFEIDLTAYAGQTVYVGFYDGNDDMFEFYIDLIEFRHTDVPEYTVTWKNWDGSVLETDADVAAGATPEYNGNEPTKPEDDENTYEFAGWTPEITAVSANAEYTATFTAVPKQAVPDVIKDCTYQLSSSDFIAFANHPFVSMSDLSPLADGAIFYSSFDFYDAMKYDYKFYDKNGNEINLPLTESDSVSGADAGLPNVETVYLKGFDFSELDTSPLYVVATAPAEPTYTVTWKNWDGSVLETDADVAEGATPEYNSNEPTKPEDDENTYTFAGWTDGTTTYALTDALPAVTADVTYTAVFDATPKSNPDQEAADAVAAMMNALPDPENVTVNDKDAIAAAGYAYAALTNAQKALIDNAVVVRYRAVAEAYAAVAKEEADQEAANGVTYLINQIPDEITANDKEAIENARRAYNMLTDDQKALVDAETLAKLEAAEEAFAALLINDSYVENESVAPGKSIKIIGAAKGGTAPYTFAYYFKKTVNTKWNKIGTEFGTATSAKFTPTSAGAYDIKVIVKDADGKTEEKLLTAEAVGELTLDTGAAVSASTIMYGESFTITAAPTGGTAPYTCKFYYKKSFNSTWHALKAKDNSAVLTPTGVGYYDLKCVVTDADGVVSQKVIQVFVDGVLPLENVSEINKDETVPVGSTITISGKAKGGKSPVTYEYFFKRSENSKWNTLKPATDAGTYAKFTLTKAASYDLKVIATDSEGTKAEKIITVTAAADT